MGAEWGVWSQAAGGFISTQETRVSVAAELDRLVSTGEDPTDLQPMEICPDHEDQPAVGCEICESYPEEVELEDDLDH